MGGSYECGAPTGSELMLGNVLIHAVNDHQNIVHMAAQHSYGYDNRRYTSYDAFWSCLGQIKDFVPCYIGCGGTEIDGVDFMFAKKILRKFESLGLGFIRDEIDGLILYLDKTFGEEEFKISKEYLHRLKRMSGS